MTDPASMLRLGTHVLANDVRNLVMLAHEITTLDLLAGGRVVTGSSFDAPTMRVSRLKESIALVKALFADEQVTFHGQHDHVKALNLHPRPLQRPHPPIIIAAAGTTSLLCPWSP